MYKELNFQQMQEMDKVAKLLKTKISRLEKELNESNIIHHKTTNEYRREVSKLTWVNDSLRNENEILKKENRELKNLLHNKINNMNKLSNTEFNNLSENEKWEQYQKEDTYNLEGEYDAYFKALGDFNMEDMYKI